MVPEWTDGSDVSGIELSRSEDCERERERIVSWAPNDGGAICQREKCKMVSVSSSTSIWKRRVHC